MRLSVLAAILSTTCLLAPAGDLAPQMTEISQRTAKPGDVITVTGFALGAKNVDEIYLTDHRFDMRVKVIEQKDNSVTFRVPPFARPGRMQLLFLTTGVAPKLLEQPLYLLIDDPESEMLTAKAPPIQSPAPASAPPAPRVSSVTTSDTSSNAAEMKTEPVSAPASTKSETKEAPAKPESRVEAAPARLDQVKIIPAKQESQLK